MNHDNQAGGAGPGNLADRIPSGGGGVVGTWYRDGKILMTRRADSIPYPGLWCFPGGGIEAGEDEVAALKREWQEELGTSIRVLRKIGSREVSTPAGRFPLHWYQVSSEQDQFHPDSREVAEVRWIAVEDVLDMPDLIGSNRKMLEALGPDLRGVFETGWQRDLRCHLDELRRQGMYRSVRPIDSAAGRKVRLEGGREVLNFASNDYLGLAGDPRLGEAVRDALGVFGWGAGGSRLICGHTTLHARLEASLATFKRTEAAIVLPTGYMANLAAIRTLAGPGDCLLLDKLDHASILDAASSCGADVRVFPHLNYDKLEQLLQRYSKARRRLIVTDTVFSMDGDLADLRRLVALKQQYNAILIVDEAHATGVLGAAGRGLAELQAVEADIDVTVGTLSKALGGLGGFVAAPAVVIETLVNQARPFIFTTGLPAAACAAALRAVEIVESEPWRRQKVLDLAQRLRRELAAAGWPASDSQSQIVPLLVGRADRAVGLAHRLLEAGIFAPAVRPPAVPVNGSRLRISVTAAHESSDIDALVGALANPSLGE
jgi:8-amino-7-oxononanoate synthase